MAAFTGANLALTALGDAEMVTASRVSLDFFSVLGARPVLGRGFTPAEDRPGGPPVVVVATVSGASVSAPTRPRWDAPWSLDGVPRTVVGVAPDWLKWGESQLYVPLQTGIPRASANDHRLVVMGRLARRRDPPGRRRLPSSTASPPAPPRTPTIPRLAAAYPQSNA
jgi:hypothetical protein